MNQVKERPILMKGEMVRAILEDRKTQTRRIVNPMPPEHMDQALHVGAGSFEAVRRSGLFRFAENETGDMWPNGPLRCKYGVPGDRLWVRETWQGPLVPYDQAQELFKHSEQFESPEFCEYRADGGPDPVFINADEEERYGWRHSIHMPRWASRITLEITDVRVERLQDISEEDALAEGVAGEQEAAAAGLDWYDKPRRAFRFLWQSINGTDSWDANPWVWVIEFRRVEQEVKAA